MKKLIIISLSFILLIVGLFIFKKDASIRISSNNHILEELEKSRVVLRNAKHEILIDGVMGFQQTNDIFYGWCNIPSVKYFLVELKRDDVFYFNSQELLNSALSKRGITPLSMKNEITYWDVRKGEKEKAKDFILEMKKNIDSAR